MNALAPLTIPRETEEHAARFLAHLDDGITRAARQLLAHESADSHRQHAADLRRAGDRMEADRFDGIADLLALDPRLYIGGMMLHRADGETHFFLHEYLRLLTEQATARSFASMEVAA